MNHCSLVKILLKKHFFIAFAFFNQLYEDLVHCIKYEESDRTQYYYKVNLLKVTLVNLAVFNTIHSMSEDMVEHFNQNDDKGKTLVKLTHVHYL